MIPPLTVAWDGSETAHAAARWAAGQAAATGAPLRLFHVHAPAGGAPRPVRPRLADPELSALDAMTRTAEELRRTHPGLGVRTVVEEGDVTALLRQAADRVGTLVLGTRGTGPAALAMGSVALAVASHAERPVILVPPGAAGAKPEGEVVVGVDLRGDCGPLLTYAFEQGRLLGARVHAVHVWRAPTALSATALSAAALSAAAHTPLEPEARDAEERVLSTELAAVQAFFPEVEAVSEEIRGNALRLLPSAAEKAALLVLGRRLGRPGPGVLGPVVPVVLGRTACPIALVAHR